MVYVGAVLSGVKTGREDIYIDLTDFIFGGWFWIHGSNEQRDGEFSHVARPHTAASRRQPPPPEGDVRYITEPTLARRRRRKAAAGVGLDLGTVYFMSQTDVSLRRPSLRNRVKYFRGLNSSAVY